MEKTDFAEGVWIVKKKHLHMRGENNLELSKVFGDEETSPHAWRKLFMVLRESKFARNISTCVEKTNYPNDNDLLPWKHLHMRGENSC